MSELVTDLDWLAATRYPEVDEDWAPTGGRHAYSEDAALTPIFHALTRGGWRSRQHEPAAPAAATRAHDPARAPAQDPAQDPVDEFRRDPLTAPIPVQALATPAAPSAPRRRRELPETGRHHRIREAGRARW